MVAGLGPSPPPGALLTSEGLERPLSRPAAGMDETRLVLLRLRPLVTSRPAEEGSRGITFSLKCWNCKHEKNLLSFDGST